MKKIVDDPMLMRMLWINSFRYAVARKSYATAEYCSYFKEYFTELPSYVKQKVFTELKAINDRNGWVGDQCDIDEWKGLIEWLEDKGVSGVMTDPFAIPEIFNTYQELVESMRAGEKEVNILFAVSDNFQIRDRVIAKYKTDLPDMFAVFDVEVSLENPHLLPQVTEALANAPKNTSSFVTDIITVTGIEGLHSASYKQFWSGLQGTRGKFNEVPCVLVIWLTEYLENVFKEKAFDFWDWRKEVFRFPMNQEKVNHDN